VAIYQGAHGAFGGAAKVARVALLRRLAETGIVDFQRYVRDPEAPYYVLETVDGQTRMPTGREVPVYLLGMLDLFAALKGQLPELMAQAFANPAVIDRETLADAILDELDRTYGHVMAEVAGLTEAAELEAVS
jgi:hypothetical protein